MTARFWSCTCVPLVARGRFRAGITVDYWLHSVECDEPVERRTTLTYRATTRKRSAASLPTTKEKPWPTSPPAQANVTCSPNSTAATAPHPRQRRQLPARNQTPALHQPRPADTTTAMDPHRHVPEPRSDRSRARRDRRGDVVMLPSRYQREAELAALAVIRTVADNVIDETTRKERITEELGAFANDMATWVS